MSQSQEFRSITSFESSYNYLTEALNSLSTNNIQKSPAINEFLTSLQNW